MSAVTSRDLEDWRPPNHKEEVQKDKVLIVDPPSGWMYGFPCIFPDDKTFEQLLKENNYPEKLWDMAMKYSRYWYMDKKEKNE